MTINLKNKKDKRKVKPLYIQLPSSSYENICVFKLENPHPQRKRNKDCKLYEVEDFNLKHVIFIVQQMTPYEDETNSVCTQILMEFFCIFKLAQSLRNQNWRTNGARKVAGNQFDQTTWTVKIKKKKKQIKMCVPSWRIPLHPTKFSLTST